MTRWADWRILAGLAVAAVVAAGGVLLVAAAHHPKALIIRPVPRPTVRVSVTMQPRVVRTIDNEPPLASPHTVTVTSHPTPAHTAKPSPTTHPTPHPTPKPSCLIICVTPL